MEDNSHNSNSLIPTKPNALVRVTDSLQITNKLIFGGIENLFNEAFYLINSEHLKGVEENYCFLIEYDSQYLKKKKFKYEANSSDNYTKATELFAQVINIKPNLKSAFLCRGIAKMKLNDYKSAIADYTKAIEIDPN